MIERINQAISNQKKIIYYYKKLQTDNSERQISQNGPLDPQYRLKTKLNKRENQKSLNEPSYKENARRSTRLQALKRRQLNADPNNTSFASKNDVSSQNQNRERVNAINTGLSQMKMMTNTPQNEIWHSQNSKTLGRSSISLKKQTMLAKRENREVSSEIAQNRTEKQEMGLKKVQEEQSTLKNAH